MSDIDWFVDGVGVTETTTLDWFVDGVGVSEMSANNPWYYYAQQTEVTG